jgi:hypothetical protein
MGFPAQKIAVLAFLYYTAKEKNVKEVQKQLSQLLWIINLIQNRA